MSSISENVNEELRSLIAKNLHRLMAKTGFERQALADKCDMGVTTISNILNASGSSNPKPITIQRLAKGMGVDVDEFYK